MRVVRPFFVYPVFESVTILDMIEVYLILSFLIWSSRGHFRHHEIPVS